MKFQKRKQGLIKVGGDFAYPYERLKSDFEKLKDEAHRLGLKFYSGENRLRAMGDSLTCCGIDGLKGFIPNTYNLNHLINDKNKIVPSNGQQTKGTGICFRAFRQNTLYGKFFEVKSVEEAMKWFYNDSQDFINNIFGINRK